METIICYCVEAVGVDAIEQATGRHGGDAERGSIGHGGGDATGAIGHGEDAAAGAKGHGGCVAPGPDNREALAALRADCLTNRRSIDLIVLHCTDTQPDRPFTIEQLRACHRARGFGAWPGYHVYIRTDGTVHYCRPLDVVGCHVKGYNAHSIGVCYEGGHRPASADSGFGFVPYHGSDKWGDTRTPAQRAVMDQVVRLLLEYYPEARVLGHNRLAAKACPCFETE